MKLTLVVLAAGMGSRYGGLKQIDGMGPHGEAILDYSVFDAVRAGFTDVVFVIRKSFAEAFEERIVRRFKTSLRTHCVCQEMDDLPPETSVPPGRVKPLGTGHAVWVARNVIDGPFAVINADDFYGRSAFLTMAARLQAFHRDGQQMHAMLATYPLASTLSYSEGCGVSRGVCDIRAQQLMMIEEIHNIQCTKDGTIVTDGERVLAPDTPVSMNFFGFNYGFMTLLGERFSEFLRSGCDLMKAEFYLPSAVSAEISSGRITVRTFSVSSEWLGVTFPDDAPVVRQKLARLSSIGEYPSPLWNVI